MEHKQVLVIRKDLNMRKGKIASQAAHASMAAILDQMKKVGNTLVLNLDDERLEPWIMGRFKKICVSVNSEAELLAIHSKAKELGLITSLIVDSGLTEFHGNATMTAVAIGPDRGDKIDEVTKHLPLL